MDYVVEERQEAMPVIGKLFGWHILHRDYFEIEPIPMANRDELARKEAEDNAISNAMDGTFGDPKIIDKKFKYDIIKGEEYKATVYIEVLEDIAEPIELMLN